MIIVILTREERAMLLSHDPNSRSRGGFQSLLVHLAETVDPSSGRLELSAEELERIQRYAFAYHRGGFQRRLVAVFGRTLGPNLGASRPYARPPLRSPR